MESYRSSDLGCRAAVLTYISAYTRELHRRGYLAGVYGKGTSTIKDLSEAYASTEYVRPDAIWLAEWDGVKSLSGFAGVPDTSWAVHQRAKQYLGDHYETHGGVKLRIDSNLLNGPVASVLRGYRSTGRITARSAPSPSATPGEVIENNVALKVVCQAPGAAVSGTKVWDKLSSGAYISDHYVNTPSATGYTAGVPRCGYPYQVTPAAGTSTKTGPGAEFDRTGSVRSGSLAWVVCQTEARALTGTSKVWNKLQNGRYVPDADLASSSTTTYSPGPPRC